MHNWAAEATIESKFLSVCSSKEAADWLAKRREKIGREIFYPSEDQERTLVERNDPYIDFALAKYGTNTNTAKEVYARGDLGLRCTFLAHFKNGGFDPIFERFDLSNETPASLEELSALLSNPSLSDGLLRNFFERKNNFEHLSEDDFQTLVYRVSSNPRLTKPYDDTFLDGWSDYSYHSVFDAAWKLAETVPNTLHWAHVLYHLLQNCLPASGFNPRPVFDRWRLETEDDNQNAGFYLRSRMADILKTDDQLLKSEDPALRHSFYKRFQPTDYPQWPEIANSEDRELFLQAAIYNENLWRTYSLRSMLEWLCWQHPDPRSNLDMPNSYRAFEVQMRSKHPDWFNDDASDPERAVEPSPYSHTEREHKTDGDRPRSKIWNWLSYSWATVWNVIVLALVFSVFNEVHDPNTRRILGALGLLYGSFVSASWWSAHSHREQARLLTFNLVEIRRLLNDKEAHRLSSELENAISVAQSSDVTGYINLLFVCLIYLWCVFVVLTT
jgi:hypothetical protein